MQQLPDRQPAWLLYCGGASQLKLRDDGAVQVTGAPPFLLHPLPHDLCQGVTLTSMKVGRSHGLNESLGYTVSLALAIPC